MFEATYIKEGKLIKHIDVTPDHLLSILKAFKDDKITNLYVTFNEKFINCESLIKNLKL